MVYGITTSTNCKDMIQRYFTRSTLPTLLISTISTRMQSSRFKIQFFWFRIPSDTTVLHCGVVFCSKNNNSFSSWCQVYCRHYRGNEEKTNICLNSSFLLINGYKVYFHTKSRCSTALHIPFLLYFHFWDKKANTKMRHRMASWIFSFSTT